MYTQILKKILRTIDFEQLHINDFLTYCHEQLADNSLELKIVEKLHNEYNQHQSIWGYTYDCFLYSMLNRALLLMDVDLITKIGFFVRNLHNHITTSMICNMVNRIISTLLLHMVVKVCLRQPLIN
jgi:hypothetical protein